MKNPFRSRSRIPAVVASAAAPVSARSLKLELLTVGKDKKVQLVAAELPQLKELVAAAECVWLNVNGPCDDETIKALAETFDVTAEKLAALVHPNKQRRAHKVEDIWTVVVTMNHINERVIPEQLTMFFNKKYVVTFQNGPAGDCLDPVRDQLKSGWAPNKKEGAEYIAALLIEEIVEHYYPIIETLGDRLDELEEDILGRTGDALPAELHEVKRDIKGLRRCVFPLRESLNKLIRDEAGFTPRAREVLRSAYDHCVVVMELVESNKEFGTDLMELHQSCTGTRLNQVMKVLTIITTLFIPPTFVAGIYGMNFNPEKSPYNMPELNWFWGYPFALGLMAFMAIAFLAFLWFSGYLTPRNERRRMRQRRWRKHDDE